MSTYTFDTTPDAGAFIQAMRNLPWSTADAIAELIDNSFDSRSGGAEMAWIAWDKRKRALQVFDNGQGMESIEDLFKIERMPTGFVPGSIGRYGFGGTFALLWLADKGTVWTLREGMISRVAFDWKKQISNGYEMKAHSAVSTAENTPRSLFDAGHGTHIKIEVPGKRQVRDSNVRRDLGTKYGPALRLGKRLMWYDQKADEYHRLAEEAEIPDPMPIKVSFELDGYTLEAEGEVGINSGVAVGDSLMAIGYGPRLLQTTKDCYRDPAGEKQYGGLGVVGYVDLNGAWMEGEFLSTTKSQIDDARARQMLMEALFEQIEPLLQEVEQEQRKVKIDLVMSELNAMFERALVSNLHPNDNGDLMGDFKGGRRHTGPDNPDPTPRNLPEAGDEPAAADEPEPEGLSLDVWPASDEQCDGTICQLDLVGSVFKGYVNEEFEALQKQLFGEAPDRGELYAYVATELARVIENRWDMTQVIFRPKDIELIESKREGVRHAFITRFLIDRVRNGTRPNGNRSTGEAAA